MGVCFGFNIICLNKFPNFQKNTPIQFEPVIPVQKYRTSTIKMKASNNVYLAETEPKTLKVDLSSNSRRDKKMEEVKHVLNRPGAADPVEVLLAIDCVHRFGIEHLFEEDIAASLQRQYLLFTSKSYSGGKEELMETALRFRLLRQHGYYVHAGVFKSYMCQKGKLKLGYDEDVEGMMCLYEASQLSIEGEVFLDEVGELGGQILSEWLSKHEDHPRARVVAHTLKNPFHRSLSRFIAKSFYLTSFQSEKGWINDLKELAEFDFDSIKPIHRKEILEISKWWKDLGLTKELKLARDEPLKWYIWPFAVITNQTLSQQRIELTKAISLIYIIDDIFDVYGTIDELKLFTEAVNRWELAAIEELKLPSYMRICFKALYDITNEIALWVYKNHGFDPRKRLQASWARLCNAFLVEAQWLVSGELPKAEEYLENGMISSGVQLALVHAFFLIGDGINKESLAFMDDNPAIISSAATILRLCDDLEGTMNGNNVGKDGSYIECYMKENKGVSAEETREHIHRMISDAWKHLNRMYLNPNPLPSSFIKACINFARITPLMYGFNKNHELSRLQEYVRSLLCDTSLAH